MRRIFTARVARGPADGFISVLLAQYLTTLGFSPFEVGAIVTGTLLGSAVLTLSFGLAARPVALRSLLLVASVVMVGTGLGFAAASTFWLLMVVAVVGTLNPTAGDVSVFLPTEQAIVATEVQGHARTEAFARYGLAGALAGAFGALLSGLPNRVSKISGLVLVTAQRIGFIFYAAIGAGVFFLYRGLRGATRPATPPREGSGRRDAPSWSSPRFFSFDSAGSGFVVTSILVLWLQLRFDLSPGVTAAVFFAGGMLAGCSQLLAPKLAARIGLIRTMAFTHIPANVALILAVFAPSGAIAITLLLAQPSCRSSTSRPGRRS